MQINNIIKAIKDNDSQKLIEFLYANALPPIVRYIAQKRGTKADAEDCFQEAVLTLIKKVKEGTYDEQYDVKNFLFILARNSWFNKLKRSGRVIASDLDHYEIEDQNAGIEDLLIDKERQEAIATLMDKAGERCKELLKLILFENKKMKEITEIMGFSTVEIVKTTHYRCKKKLKEALKDDHQLLMALKG